MLYADLETYSEVNISRGVHAYAEQAEILLFGYAIDDAPAKVWDCTGEPCPQELKDALDRVCKKEDHVVFHNGMMFDSVIIKHVMGLEIPPSQLIDTMVIAYQAGLPGKLGDLCTLFKLGEDVAKDKDGARLVRMFCTPNASNCKTRRFTKETHPEDWARFVNYCRLDIEAERALLKRLPRTNAIVDKDIQVVDAIINNRGFAVDVDFARKAVEACEQEKQNIDSDIKEKTNGALDTVGQRDALLDYIKREYGWDLPTLGKAEVERAINEDAVPEEVRDILRLRLVGSKTSVTKYKTILDAVSSDGRLRGCMQFRGASRTGRFAGRTFQPQNLPRPTHSQEEIDQAIEDTKAGLAPFIYDDIQERMASCIRSCIVAPEGKKLVVADYSNVEGRVLAWLAEEDWKVQAFEAFDNGEGADLYKVTYGRAFNINPKDVTKAQRQVGKVMELGLGYGGGPGAFLTFANTYGMDLNELAKLVKENSDPLIYSDAVQSYDWFKEQGLAKGMSKEVFIACDAIKRAWRKANSKIAQYWSDVESACTRAIVTGEVQRLPRGIQVSANRWFLSIKLPSGRALMYPLPRVPTEGERYTFKYQGVDQRTRKWGVQYTYGGKLVENITQAVACDLLCNALVNLEHRGYSPVLHIHDEVVCEVPDTDAYTLGEMSGLMCALPPWANGLPLVSAGYESHRYKKD